MRQWIILIILLSMPGIIQAAETLSKTPTLRFEIAVPPGSELHATLSGSLKDILQKEGYNLQITSLPPKRGLQELKAGRMDGSVGRIGNLASLLGNKDLIRVDAPVAVFQVSRWCRKDLEKSSPTITLGTRLGTLVLMILKEHMTLSRIKLEEIGNQKGIVQMLKTERLDCLLSSDLLLEADGVSAQDLNGLDRFDLVSFAVYPWILKRHLPLKELLESGLKAYPYSESFRKKFQDQKPACEGKVNLLCPDGVIIQKKVDLG